MRRAFLPTCLLLLVACQPGPPHARGAAGIGDPYYPDLGNGGYDAQEYTLALNIDPPTNQVAATATIQAKATENLGSFNLDFIGLTVDSIMVNGAKARYGRTTHELSITPSRPLRAGDKFTVVIAYHGRPAAVPAVTSRAALGSMGWGHAQNGAINVLSEPNGAAGWYPVNDHPRDKAMYRFEVTVPKPWIVAATGTLAATTDEGARTQFVWVMDKPMASYLASVDVDRYALRTLDGPHGIRIRNYFPPGYPESQLANFDRLPEMLAYLETVYGPYPFQEYGVVIANAGAPLCEAGGAIEAQTLSVHCPSPGMASEAVIVHELAHQWFGDSVSLENWKDIWLKEGMATYAQWLWLTRDQDLQILTKLVEGQMAFRKVHSRVGDPPSADLYRDESYTGGAIVFHALRLKVGEEAFAKILRTFLDRYKYANAGSDEFIAVSEEVSGQELGPFFDSWLYSTSFPPMQ